MTTKNYILVVVVSPLKNLFGQVSEAGPYLDMLHSEYEHVNPNQSPKGLLSKPYAWTYNCGSNLNKNLSMVAVRTLYFYILLFIFIH